MNVRDWLFVEDHVRGIDLVLKKGAVGETYNIGGNEEHPNLAIVDIVCAVIDRVFAEDASLAGRFPAAPSAKGGLSKSLIEFVKDRPGHDRRYAIDAAKIERELGFHPAHSFEDGIEKTVRWMLSNESWWRSILDESYRDWIATQYAD